MEKLAHLPHLRHRHHAKRGHVPSSTDFDTANAIEVRKYLKTYGLTPPGVDTFEKQEQRCEHIRRGLVRCDVTDAIRTGLAILESRKTPIEKYQYLSVLRNSNVHLFYRLLAANVKVRICCVGSTMTRIRR
jgi:malate dehydrogenase (oxaloacetate-decarboxylating)(NADP+)